MTTLREAAQQALEALEGVIYRIERDLEHGHEWAVVERELASEAIAALRAALAEPDYWQEEARRYAGNADYWRKRCVSCGGALPATGQDDRTGECVCGEPTALNTVHRTDGPCYVAEPVQEPVAWRYKPMVGSPWSLSDDGYYISCKRDQRYFVEALYTAPPQRKPLAEWQINDLIADIDPEDVCSWSFRQGVYAAEKHHGVRP